MAITFGLDISHHQDLALDLAQCRRDGCEFVFLKATEGASMTDPEFAPNLAEARAAGMLVAAYVYQRSGATAAAHVERVKAVVPRDVPVIPDVEAGSGSLALTRDMINGLRAAGYRVPLLYLPRWYWQQLGSPSLGGLPPLWSSRYPDNVVGTLPAEWADVPARYWDGYGGLSVAVLQFTSSTRIAGHQPLDANAYRGTRAELAALLGGQSQEDDMISQEDFNNLMWTYRFDDDGKGHTGNFAQAIKGMRDTLNQLVGLVSKGAGASPDDVAAALLPALTTAVVAEVAKRDAISDADAAQIAAAVTARAGVLLGGGQ